MLSCVLPMDFINIRNGIKIHLLLSLPPAQDDSSGKVQTAPWVTTPNAADARKWDAINAKGIWARGLILPRRWGSGTAQLSGVGLCRRGALICADFLVCVVEQAGHSDLQVLRANNNHPVLFHLLRNSPHFCGCHYSYEAVQGFLSCPRGHCIFEEKSKAWRDRGLWPGLDVAVPETLLKQLTCCFNLCFTFLLCVQVLLPIDLIE